LTNSGKYNGLDFAEAVKAIIADLQAIDKGSATITYRLRDWLVSRQRYWGTPIPIIYCDHCGVVPVPEDQLPVELPYDVEFKPDGESPLKKCRSFIETTCPTCGGPARRDPDTLDTFVCSSWYQFRFVDNKNRQRCLSIEKKLIRCARLINTLAAPNMPRCIFCMRDSLPKPCATWDTWILTSLSALWYIKAPFSGPMVRKCPNHAGIPSHPMITFSKTVRMFFACILAFGFAYTDGGPWNDDGVRAIAKFIGRVERLVEQVAVMTDEPFEGTGAAETRITLCFKLRHSGGHRRCRPIPVQHLHRTHDGIAECHQQVSDRQSIGPTRIAIA
jgi:leucyl-tRNA synthetase